MYCWVVKHYITLSSGNLSNLRLLDLWSGQISEHLDFSVYCVLYKHNMYMNISTIFTVETQYTLLTLIH